MEKIIPGEILAQETVKSSSSDNVYTVTLYDNCISCNCPAGGRKTFCKHMVAIVHKNLELIRETNTDFYNNLALLLEMKNDKNHNINEFKELSVKLICSNKTIANQAYHNARSLQQEDIKEKVYKPKKATRDIQVATIKVDLSDTIRRCERKFYIEAFKQAAIALFKALFKIK